MFDFPELNEKIKNFENGQILTQKSFDFKSQLGTGSFGKVYRVESKDTSNEYALKVLS